MKDKPAKNLIADIPTSRTDHVSPNIRSSIMRAVKSKGARSAGGDCDRRLSPVGLGLANERRRLPDKPDVVFRRTGWYSSMVFWHGCRKCYRRPRSNQPYWDAKVAKNIERDKSKRAQLRRLGWTVIRFWEHDVEKSSPVAVDKINAKIVKGCRALNA